MFSRTFFYNYIANFLLAILNSEEEEGLDIHAEQYHMLDYFLSL